MQNISLPRKSIFQIFHLDSACIGSKMSQAQTVHVDIVSDVMCPWCYIGKRRFEKAITLLGDLVAEVCWRPFQLDETLPIEGKDRKSYLAEKFGGMENASSIYDAIKKAGDQEQISFAFEKINKSPEYAKLSSFDQMV